MALRSLPRLLAAIVVLSACSSAPRGSLVLELAPEAGSCGRQTASFEADWQCLRIQICPSPEAAGPAIDAGARDAGDRDAGPPSSGCVEITTPGGDHDEATDELIVGRTTLVAFDARVDPDRLYDVSVTAYGAGGAAVATGRTRYVSPLGGDIRVRLHRYGTSSCLGLGEGDAAPVHRAFGAAIPLVGGDVLFFGGVSAGDVPASRLSPVARFQRDVQVYDVNDARFHPVTVVNNAEPSAGRGLARVLFEARDYGVGSDGRQRIRIFGGFGSSAEPAVALRFDQNMVYTAYGLPVIPSIDASASPAVDLFYDPATRTATIELVATDVAVPSSGGAGVSEVVGGRVISVGGINTNGGPTNLARPDMVAPTVSGVFQQWDEDALTASYPVGTVTDDAGRYGATVTYLSGSSYLAWGGAIRVTTADAHRDHAGVLIDVPISGVTSTLISAPELGPLPQPVAFHTATRLAPDHVLITGGVPITTTFTTARPSLGLAPEPPGFSVLVRDAGTFRSTTVSGAPRRATIYHQATVLAEAAGVPTAVLITGGAGIAPFPSASTTLTTLWSSGEVGVVTGSGDAWTYRVATTLRTPRFGHTTTVIPGVGVIVVGGYREEITGTAPSEVVELQPVLDAELFLIEDLLGLEPPRPVECGDAGVPRDAGGRDSGVIDDAGAPDAGVPDDAPAELDAPDAPI